MSRATVRAALAAWIAPTNVTFLNKVYTSEPKIQLGADYFSGPGVNSGAIGWVMIEKEMELRRAMGGAHSGKKRIRYDVAIVLHFRSAQLQSEAAMNDYDVLIESLKQRIRADRTLGAPNVVFQAGEEMLKLDSQPPFIDGDITNVLGVLRLEIIEWITS